MDDPHNRGEDSSDYEPPQIQDLPAHDGPAVTAPGVDGGSSPLPGPEWRGGGTADPESRLTEPDARTQA